VLFSGGSYRDDDRFLSDVEMGMEAGAVGLIAGRNMWQRPRAEALPMIDRVRALLDNFAVPES
jgi:class I fructose-bisphosphate aldolase